MGEKNRASEKKALSVRSMVFVAVTAAIICLAAPVSIPMPGLVPVSLATFAIYLSSALVGAKKGTAAVLVYVLLGAVGLPVFSGAQAGLGVLFGVTGGYIIGYIPLALLSGLFSDIYFARPGKKRVWLMPAGMILGTAALYTFGTVWFMIARGADLLTALVSCVVPFLPGDSIKIACSCAAAVPLRKRLKSFISEI